MRAALLAVALVVSSAGVAAADGWIDCNGPDKNGRGCTTSGRDGASTGAGLALLSVVTLIIGRKRRTGEPGVHGDDRDR